MSFMDSFFGYNQIGMYSDDEKHTSFQTLQGVYCYTIMPFWLNVGATYQRARMMIFCDHLQKFMECYVEDIAVKSQNKDDQIQDCKQYLT